MAADREAAYAQLKAAGIKPSRMIEAPGALNKIFGKGKRWIAIASLLAVCLFLYVYLIRQRGIVRAAEEDARITVSTFDAQTRRQVIGDAAIIDQGIREGWSSVFEEEGERFLASFAIPGVPAGIRSTTEEEIRQSLARRVESNENDPIEARQIKAMVEGMKNELREFMKDGGTIRQYGQQLVRRQEEELSYYRRAKAALDEAIQTKAPVDELSSLLSRYNNSLRQMGIKLLVLPE